MVPTSSERVRKHRLKRKNDKDTWMADKVKERERIKRYREKKKSTLNKEELDQQRSMKLKEKQPKERKKTKLKGSKKCRDMIISEEQPSTPMMTP
ncbi:hypothetical protein AVEN_13654-1 [Araneus ventricosus]|uniref:Uncharacterized protein n=1 Tax=Araneus ventricosus TaxID=182803 RepID=A0A4Y2L8F5_ARAVE|nr:hypothetical protein AVEN_13654-1 [Araneus ventricosus]